ncbi:prolipoprotein diacylglyceryl transferase [Gordonia sp. C13]|uniref:prolipoprotein diacylglyceryl transferase n=1 Tax=Gordonia sp. C13 TaxID=2935078 RepID=UPI00200B249A|nr:prolipoprotein diacylglyceryl transferase [Gordonia sp. C13]MCK8615707.1 prolipoprotein diacylglyceryl transferase [Gordonia sp. C13]
MNAPTTTMLAYIPSPPQGVWEIGPFPLRAYALCIIAGIIVAIWWGNRRWVARGGQEGEVLDVAIWAVPFGLLGGRLYHLITDWKTYFGADAPKEPLDALRIWDGGLGIWGAVALGAVGAWIGARRRGIRLPAFGDAIAPPILLAQAIGRLGNYFNQELYGRETTLPWGLEIYERVNKAGYANAGLIDGRSNGVVVAVVQPTFLYELLWNVLIVILLVVIDRRFRIGHGRLFALYIAGYCLGRFFIEMLRDDRAAVANYIAGIRPNLFTAALVFVCAIVYFVVAPKGREQGLEMYHPERAAELEEQGVAGYVDDWYDEDFDDLDAVEDEQPSSEVDTLDALDAEADKIETTRGSAAPAVAPKVPDDEPTAEAAEEPSPEDESPEAGEAAEPVVPVVDDAAVDDVTVEETDTAEPEVGEGEVVPDAADAEVAEPDGAEPDEAEPAEVADAEVGEAEAEDDAPADAEATATEAAGGASVEAAADEAGSVVDSEDEVTSAVETGDDVTGVVESEDEAADVVESEDPATGAAATEDPATGVVATEDEASTVIEPEDTASSVIEPEDTATGAADSEDSTPGVAATDPEPSDAATGDVEAGDVHGGDAESTVADPAVTNAPDAGGTGATSSLRRRLGSRFGRRRRS